MKMNKLVEVSMMVAMIAIALGCASSSYSQETSTTDTTIVPANGVPPPTPYVNAGKGYKIGGTLVLAEPGGLSLGNIALGGDALFSNTTGTGNTASGDSALYGNTTGIGNTASGSQALFSNTTGSTNTAIGIGALYSNDNGGNNTASGYIALDNNTSGTSNTASGFEALYSNTTGNDNIAIGAEAAINVSGLNSFNIHIGSPGKRYDSGAIRIGDGKQQTASYIAGIAGVTLPTANEPLVCIDPAGPGGRVEAVVGPIFRVG